MERRARTRPPGACDLWTRTARGHRPIPGKACRLLDPGRAAGLRPQSGSLRLRCSNRQGRQSSFRRPFCNPGLAAGNLGAHRSQRRWPRRSAELLPDPGLHRLRRQTRPGGCPFPGSLDQYRSRLGSRPRPLSKPPRVRSRCARMQHRFHPRARPRRVRRGHRRRPVSPGRRAVGAVSQSPAGGPRSISIAMG